MFSKKKKALLAAGAGAAILAASGATFALWQTDVTISGVDVQTGYIAVNPVEDISNWQDRSPIMVWPRGSGNLVANFGQPDTGLDYYPAIPVLADFRLSPGDVIVGSAEVTGTVVGTNLVAALYTGTDLDTATPVPGITVTPNIISPGSVNAAGVFDGAVVEFIVTFNPQYGQYNQVSMDETVVLDGTTLVLRQVRELPAP